MKTVRTRFAPSPTGMQHVGGFRTAMYAWLLARSHGGQFILRIEDTDRERTVPGAVKYLIESLQWLGIDYDEGPSAQDLKNISEYWEGAPDVGGAKGPYVQSQRINCYEKVAEELIEKGLAYRCDCTSEMLERERNEQLARKETPGYSGYCRTRNVSKDCKHVIRFKIPAKVDLSIEDAVRGVITWDNPSLKDTVILKSDRFPTYHLASVVDDHLMEISHVMRGEEWISTTPLHLLLYDALGWERPVFCHLSHILGSDGKKLSKRHGASSLNEYRDIGYLSQAILNFMVLIGWSPGEGDNQEVFSREELIKKFSIDHLAKASGIFDSNKLLWMNGVYIRNLPIDEFTKQSRFFIDRAGLNFNSQRWDLIAPFVQERLKLMTEIPEMVEFLFVDNVTPDLKEAVGSNDPLVVKEILNIVASELRDLSDFSIKSIEECLRSIAAARELKVGQVFMPVRIAVTGKKISPPLFESIYALGRDAAVNRLQKLAELI